jgi:hypothetical protein
MQIRDEAMCNGVEPSPGRLHQSSQFADVAIRADTSIHDGATLGQDDDGPDVAPRAGNVQRRCRPGAQDRASLDQQLDLSQVATYRAQRRVHHRPAVLVVAPTSAPDARSGDNHHKLFGISNATSRDGRNRLNQEVE